jgi:putative methyltransferase (TIGR04325 family)
MGNRGIPTHIFKGTFSDFKSTNSTTDPYHQQIWIEKSVASLLEVIDPAAGQQPQYLASNNYLLNTAIFSLRELPKIRVVDVGGNLGQDYFKAVKFMPSIQNKLEWTVYENRELVNIGIEYFGTNPHLSFSSYPQTVSGESEILHFGSVIQYFDEWKSIIESYIEKNSPKYVVCSDTMAGANTEEVTTQDYYGNFMPFRFLNAGQFLEFMSSRDYRLECSESYIHCKTQIYFQNMPSDNLNKFTNSVNYIFTRNTA